MTIEIDPAIVEVAARVSFKSCWNVEWDNAAIDVRATWQSIILAALQAAAPLLVAGERARKIATQKEWTWEDWFQWRHRTGGTDRAATMLANMRCPQDSRPVPEDQDAMTGVMPPKEAK